MAAFEELRRTRPRGLPMTRRVTWLGHSTVLIELGGVRLLTDPVLRERLLHMRRVAARGRSGAAHGRSARC